MADIIPLHGDRHHEARELLPWYANDTLDDADRAKVEAHLAGCPECRAELAAERRLKQQVAELPVDSSPDWAAMRRRIEESAAAPVAAIPMPSAPARRSWPRPSRAGWIITAQAAALVLLASFSLFQNRDVRPEYHTLGAAPVVATGNVIVMFRPTASEEYMRGALRSADARIVGGPTEANAYLVHVPGNTRDAALATLRAQPAVVLAQPIDPDPVE